MLPHPGYIRAFTFTANYTRCLQLQEGAMTLWYEGTILLSNDIADIWSKTGREHRSIQIGDVY